MDGERERLAMAFRALEGLDIEVGEVRVLRREMSKETVVFLHGYEVLLVSDDGHVTAPEHPGMYRV